MADPAWHASMHRAQPAVRGLLYFRAVQLPLTWRSQLARPYLPYRRSTLRGPTSIRASWYVVCIAPAAAVLAMAIRSCASMNSPEYPVMSWKSTRNCGPRVLATSSLAALISAWVATLVLLGAWLDLALRKLSRGCRLHVCPVLTGERNAVADALGELLKQRSKPPSVECAPCCST